VNPGVAGLTDDIVRRSIGDDQVVFPKITYPAPAFKAPGGSSRYAAFNNSNKIA